MIEVTISSSRLYHINYLAVDFNDTLACNGILEDAISALLQTLSELVEIYVLTSDTFGTVNEQLTELPCHLHIIASENQAAHKQKFIQKIGVNKTIAIGNGTNDYLMLKTAALGIVVIEREGASMLAVNNADLVCRGIMDALVLPIHPKRIKATLRS